MGSRHLPEKGDAAAEALVGRRDQAAEHRALYARTGLTMTMRSAGEITQMLGAWRLVEPGLVTMPLWRPGADDEVPEDAERMAGYAGVARKLDDEPTGR